MLQPKKPNPVQKNKRKTAPGQYTSDIDWDQVRKVNDNVAVQTAKMFDPTGISSYPDVYYAAKDLSEGKGSWGELGLNVLGALPMIGKAKTIFRLAKAAKASKTIKNTKKVINGIEEVASTLNKVTNPANIKPLIKAKSVAVSSKQIGKADVKNLAIDLLDIGNVAADATSVVKAGVPVVEEASKNIKKVLETPSLIDKKKIIQYYNQDPRRGEVETPGKLANVDYRTINNSAELKMWEQQKLAFGTNQDGIMKKSMNPRKKYANGTNTKGVGPNNYIQTPNDVLNDYNIMLAGVEKEVANNKLVPIVSAVGGLMQQAIGMAGSFAGQSGIKPGSKGALDKVLDVDPNKIMLQGAEGTVAANGNNSVQKDVEVEGGEMYETPQGQVGEFQGPSHEQGGIPLEVGQDVEEGTKVYSDRLKVGDKTLAERKEARERQIANLEKIASQPLVDSAVKNATKRRMMAIQKEESADLQFQEQVNNMQQMADIMVAAFGTGVTGLQDNPIGDSMKYGYGSGSKGVMKYALGTGEDGIDPTTEKAYDSWYIASVNDLVKKYPKMGEGLYSSSEAKKEFQTFLFGDKAGTKDADNNYSIDGDFGKTTNAFAKNYADISKHYEDIEGLNNYDMYPGWRVDDKKIADGTYKAPAIAGDTGVEMDLVTAEKPGFDWKTMPEVPELVMRGKEGVENGAVSRVQNPGENKKEPSQFMKSLAGNIPGVGDLTKLFGNYLGMTAGIKTAAEQRSTDITHTNVYKNAGKESQKLLDNAKQGIETSKAQAMVKATDVGRGGKRGARNSARGVNQMRGMDWLYDTALQGQLAEISANAAQQISGIDVQKSGVAMNADQLRGKGEYDAAMANEAAKDAYYTALGMGRKDFATGMQQSGKDLNDMKQNQIIQNLMKDYGKWFKADATGISNKK